MDSPFDKTTVFHFRAPSIEDRVGKSRLLVWGDLAHWLSVDDELYSFLKLFDGKRSLKKVIEKFAALKNKTVEQARAEAHIVIPELTRRGVLFVTKPEKPDHESEPYKIANVTINLTNRCNLKCSFCYNKNRKSSEMDIVDLVNGIEAGKHILNKDASLIILGGEPLLTPDRLFRLVDKARHLFNAPPLVSTNGTLVTDQLADELAKRGMDIQVSIDDTDPQKHDKFRGRGTHLSAIRGVETLLDAGVKTTMSKVYTSDNYDDFESYLEMALGLGVNEVRFIPMRLIGGGMNNQNLGPNQMTVFVHLLDVLKRRPEFSPLLKRDYFSIQASVCRHSSFRTGCGVGKRVVFIDADGSVFPCPNHAQGQFNAGNLQEDDLATIFLNSKVFEELRSCYQLSNYDECRDCIYRHWCGGDCRGEVLSCTNNPLSPSPHCAELKELFHKMICLIAKNDPRLNLGGNPDEFV